LKITDKQTMNDTEYNIAKGKEYPYHGKAPQNKAEAAALGILYDLCHRVGIKWELEKVEDSIRREIVESMAFIIRQLPTFRASCYKSIAVWYGPDYYLLFAG